jgi:hypothetical protein
VKRGVEGLEFGGVLSGLIGQRGVERGVHPGQELVQRGQIRSAAAVSGQSRCAGFDDDSVVECVPDRSLVAAHLATHLGGVNRWRLNRKASSATAAHRDQSFALQHRDGSADGGP